MKGIIMSFVFSNSIVRWMKLERVSMETVRQSIDSAIAESVKGSASERTETVRVSGSKTITASVTVKDVTKAGKLAVNLPLRFAYLSQTLSTLEKVGCAPSNIIPEKELAEWAMQFAHAEAIA